VWDFPGRLTTWQVGVAHNLVDVLGLIRIVRPGAPGVIYQSGWHTRVTFRWTANPFADAAIVGPVQLQVFLLDDVGFADVEVVVLANEEATDPRTRRP